MKNYAYISFLLLALLSACSSKVLVYKGHDEGKEIRVIQDSIGHSAHIDSLIYPYKIQLDAQMNEVLGVNDLEMTKEKPESSLGNFMADALLAETDSNCSSKADFAIVNYGGIRLPGMKQGDITRGKMFELMPFENKMVCLELDGPVTAQLFDYMARGGAWPIAGATYDIKKESAVNIRIGGKVFDITRHYRVALSDYLANGGDNLSFLKNIPQDDCHILLRDALIHYVKNQQHIHSEKTGRVKYVEAERVH